MADTIKQSRRNDLILADRAGGWTIAALAYKYGLGAQTIRNIVDEPREKREKRRERAERDNQILQEYLTNPEATLQSIANRYGITRERVRQVIALNVGPADRAARDASPILSRYTPEQQAEIESRHYNRETMAEELGVSTRTLTRNGWRARGALRPTGFQEYITSSIHPGGGWWDPKERYRLLCEDILAFAERNNGDSPSVHELAIWRQDNGRATAGWQQIVATLRRNDTTYGQCLESLGLPTGSALTQRRVDAKPIEEINRTIAKFVAAMRSQNRPPTVDAYRAWRETQSPKPVTDKVLRDRFGTPWPEIIMIGYERVLADDALEELMSAKLEGMEGSR